MKQNEIKVRLNILDFECSFEEISKILDLKPTGTLKEGDPIPNTILKRKQNCWYLEPDLQFKKGTLEDQSEAIFNMIGSKIKNFKNLPSNANIELSCWMDVCEENGFPEIHLSGPLTHKLGLINAAFDLDIYSLPN